MDGNEKKYKQQHDPNIACEISPRMITKATNYYSYRDGFMLVFLIAAEHFNECLTDE